MKEVRTGKGMGEGWARDGGKTRKETTEEKVGVSCDARWELSITGIAFRHKCGHLASSYQSTNIFQSLGLTSLLSVKILNLLLELFDTRL